MAHNARSFGASRIAVLLTTAVVAVLFGCSQVNAAGGITIAYGKQFSTDCTEPNHLSDSFFAFDGGCRSNEDSGSPVSFRINCTEDGADFIVQYDSLDCSGTGSASVITGKDVCIPLGDGNLMVTCTTLPYAFTKTEYTPDCDGTAGTVEFALAPGLCLENKAAVLYENNILQIFTWPDDTLCQGDYQSVAEVTLDTCDVNSSFMFSLIGDAPSELSKSPSQSPTASPNVPTTAQPTSSPVVATTKSPTSGAASAQMAVLSFVCSVLAVMFAVLN